MEKDLGDSLPKIFINGEDAERYANRMLIEAQELKCFGNALAAYTRKK